MKKIVWQSWQSFVEDEHEADTVGHEPESESDFDDGGLGILKALDLSAPLSIDTPLGRYHEDDSMLPTRMFDCWLLYSNFDIDEDCVRKIAACPGVEVARVITRYRVFIGIGKLFDSAEVRLTLQKSLLQSDELQYSTTADEAKAHKFWAGFQRPDGSEQYIFTDLENDDEYRAGLLLLRLVSQMYSYDLEESDENDVYLDEDQD